MRDRSLSISIGLILFLALFGGWQIAGGVRQIIIRDELRERARIENEAARAELAHRAAMEPWRRAGEVAAGAIALAGLAGLAWAGVAYAYRRAGEIRPGPDGQFPLIRLRVAGGWIIHDPNRQITGTTIYASLDRAGQIAVIPVIPPGAERAQGRATMMAQLLQIASAIHRHPPILAQPGGGGAAPISLAPAEEPESPPPPWPSRVPLLGLLEGRPSLSRLILGISIREEDGSPEIIRGDMQRLVHVAVGGSSGWGKSAFLRALGYQLILAEEQPDLLLIDLEGATLAPFSQSDRLLYPMAESEEEALALLQELNEELDRRREAFASHPGTDSLAAYNARARAEQRLRPIIALVDEGTALLGNREIERAMRRVALRGRKYGLWMVLAGQDWRARSLDPAIRNQLATRVQFKALSASQSQVLLGQSGAERLEDVPGRALAAIPGRGLIKIQAPWISLEQIQAALAGQGGPRNASPRREGRAAADGEIVARIREMRATGMSMRQIELALFGYAGGRAHDIVRGALQEGATTTTNPSRSPTRAGGKEE